MPKAPQRRTPVTPDELTRRNVARAEKRRALYLADVIEELPPKPYISAIRYHAFTPDEHDLFVAFFAEAMWHAATSGATKADVHWLDKLQGDLRACLSAHPRFVQCLDGWLPMRVALLAHELEPMHVPAVVEHVEQEFRLGAKSAGLLVGDIIRYVKHRPRLLELLHGILADCRTRGADDPLHLCHAYDVRVQFWKPDSSMRILLKRRVEVPF